MQSGLESQRYGTTLTELVELANKPKFFTKGLSMKLIEAMKQIKDLMRKAEDLRTKIAKYCAYQSPVESPTYPDQKGQVSLWLQSHSDILKEILRLRVAIQRTNLNTTVAIELGGKTVTKSIAEWIHRRRDLAKLEVAAWQQLTNKGLRTGKMKNTQDEIVQITLELCYDPTEKDRNLDMYLSEPSTIDGRLEVINAVTDLLE